MRLVPLSWAVFERCLQRLQRKKDQELVEWCWENSRDRVAACKERRRRYRQEHREQRREANKKWRMYNRDKVVAYDRKYYQQHREALKERRRRRYHEHREQYRETKKKWRMNNRDKIAAYDRKYHQQHPKVRERKALEFRCGLCLSCGAWAAPWKPTWYVRLDTWLTTLTSQSCMERRIQTMEERIVTDSEAETSSTVSGVVNFFISS